MKYELYKKQVISTVREAMNTERMIYNELIEEEPEGKYEYALMRRAGIEGIAKGAIAMIEVSEYSFAQKESIIKAIKKQSKEYKNEV